MERDGEPTPGAVQTDAGGVAGTAEDNGDLAGVEAFPAGQREDLAVGVAEAAERIVPLSPDATVRTALVDHGLLAGSFEATILNAGFDVRAQAEGASLLVPTVDVIPDYLSTVLAARGEYLDQAPDPVSRFVSAFRQAMNDCLDPARHADCTDLVVSEWQVTPDVAARMVDAAADARTGVVPDAVIRPAQLEVVLELRKRWGGFSEDVDIAAEIRRPRGLIDERFARTA